MVLIKIQSVLLFLKKGFTVVILKFLNKNQYEWQCALKKMNGSGRELHW